MKAALPGLGLLAALIIVPFALRPVELVDDPDATKLSILTPQSSILNLCIVLSAKPTRRR